MPVPARLPIEDAPPKVRLHGLSDAHIRPKVCGYVGRGASRRRDFKSRIHVPPANAWRHPFLQLHAANTYVGLILDCDDEQAMWEAIVWPRVREPSWIVQNKANGHCHAVWTLRKPVHRYPEARPKPLQLLKRVDSYYHGQTSADPGYSGFLTRNPMHWADRSTVTHWKHKGGYSLEELAEVIPFGWKMPCKVRTGIGRNVDMFQELMRWAGRKENRGIDVAVAAETRNQVFEKEGRGRLPASEVRATVKKVTEYRQAWAARNWHCPAWIRRQRTRARIGADKRRQRTEDRDHAISVAVALGFSMREVANGWGLSGRAVHRIFHRPGPFPWHYKSRLNQYA